MKFSISRYINKMHYNKGWKARKAGKPGKPGKVKVKMALANTGSAAAPPAGV